MIELFTTTTCTKCPRLKQYLNEIKVEFSERVIDLDTEVETDALMLGIYSAPALKDGNSILKTKDIFHDGIFDKVRVTKFLKLYNENNEEK